MSSLQILATIFFNLAIPIFIGAKTNIWLGLLTFTISVILNGVIGWVIVIKYSSIAKPVMPYLKMVLVAIFVFWVTYIINYK